MTILGETVEALWARPRREQPHPQRRGLHREPARPQTRRALHGQPPVSEPVDHPVIRPSINALARTYDLALEQPELATAYSGDQRA